jgi:glycosyltransferase involved in cell wall biosynthesis
MFRLVVYFAFMFTLTIVTICFNNPDDVRASCASVDAQAVKPMEHLIIDGSSKPDIKQWLEGNPQPAYRRWICERDKGIGDAFNKGVQNAKGDIVFLLNSGDTLYDETVVRRVMEVFEADPTIMWVNGKLNMFRGGIWTIAGKAFEKEKLYRGMHGVYHPTMYIKKEAYDRCGVYDITVKYAMDYDLMCRIANEKSAFIDYPLATFDPNGQSSVQYKASTAEMFACYQKYYGKSLKQELWSKRLMFMHRLLNSNAGKALYRMKVKAGMQKT